MKKYIEILEKNKEEIDKELENIKDHLNQKDYDAFWKNLVTLLGKCGVAIKLCESKFPELKDKLNKRIEEQKNNEIKPFICIPKRKIYN